MAKLLYQGHGSLRLTTNDGLVVYIDPFAGKGYDVPADLVLVTHQHHDHNKLKLITWKDGENVFSNREALSAPDCYMTYHTDDDCFYARAVQAYNKNHKRDECVGLIIETDGVKLYVSGDTSTTEEMETFADLKLDYAILCGDGRFNMGPDESAQCARLIGAKHNMLYHMAPGELSHRAVANAWDAPNKLIMEPGQEIDL